MCLKLGFVQQFGVVMKVADYRALIANSESAVQFAVRIAYAILCSKFIIDDKTMSGFAVAFKFENIILEYLDAVLVSRSDELVHGICVHTAFSPEYALIDYRIRRRIPICWAAVRRSCLFSRPCGGSDL